MLSKIRAWLSGPTTSTRSYDGAAGGYRAGALSETANVIAAMAAARTPLARRARYLVGNNALAFSGVEAWTAALVAYGIKAQSQHADQGVRSILTSRFGSFADEADADGVGDLYSIQALMVRQMVTEGESFALLINTAEGLRVRVIDNEQVDPNITRTLPDGGRIIQGVEFSGDGRRVAYWILPDNPGLPYGAASMTARRVPSHDVVHLFRQLVPGQVRGVSWLSPVILRLSGLDLWADAQLTRQQMAAMLTIFIKGGDGTGAPFDASLASKGIAPGGVRYLDEGQEPMFLTPASIGEEVIKFAEIQERHIAVGLSLPLFVLNGDLSQANYGSQRGGLTEWRRRVGSIVHLTIAPQLLTPIWQRWVATEVLSGAVSTTIEEALPVNWIPPKFDWIDPAKDIEAEALAVEVGFKSRTESLAERGQDAEAVDAEIAAERARAKALGLDFTRRPAANSNTPPPVADAA